MITPDGWFDWAIRKPIPNDPSTGMPWKTNPGINTAKLFLPHSAVGEGFNGWWQGIQGGIYFPTQLWINKREQDGVFQLYPIFSQCWASGSGYPNNNGIAAENQGGSIGNVNEPQTDFQVAACIRICRDLAQFHGVDAAAYFHRPVDIRDLTATLYEHRECIRFGSAPTACPSARIRWQAIITGLMTTNLDGDDGMMYIVSKDNTGDPDSYKDYLVRGKEYRHIPDKETFDSLAALQLPLYEPNKVAWEFMIKGAVIIE